MSHWAGPYVVKNVIIIIFKFITDASVHMDNYTAPLTQAQDGRKVYWDS